MSPAVVFPRSRLVEVAWADAGDPASVADAADVSVAVVGIPVVETPDGPAVAPGVPTGVVVSVGGDGLDTGLDTGRARQRGFKGKVGQTMVVVGQTMVVVGEHSAQGSLGAEAPAVVFVGCGKETNAGSMRRAAAALVRVGGKSGAGVLILPGSVVEEAGTPVGTVQAVVEGAVLAAYRFVSHKRDTEGGGIERFVVAGVGIDTGDLAEGTRRGVAVADAVCLARDLINEPPSSLTPTRFAQAAQEHAAGRPGVTTEVWDEQRISDERLGGLLGVARGSAEPPRLLKISYEPADPLTVDGKVPHVVLVGKGITFDSGGLSLKTPDGMVTMKTDMSGAAAVLAAVSACGEVGVRVRVTAITPTTENMPGGRATKPGDVLTIRNGRTIEVLNTDAEGRLVLADGLTLATELEPDAIVDLATLTGACVVALGMSIAGLFGSDEGLIGRVRAASERAGEGTWQLPLPEEYRSHIDSEIADMKNVGKGGQAGAISAALLLAEFVEDVPWVHLDIAGPARSDEDSGILAKGGTGFGVRTLLELLEHYGSD
ncbi:MAG TPA: leucyl aminopeptidase [Acidimicrobiales bacterium]|nr:leucyl aminopeptidase [Acidimicrobiales bacterium]